MTEAVYRIASTIQELAKQHRVPVVVSEIIFDSGDLDRKMRSGLENFDMYTATLQVDYSGERVTLNGVPTSPEALKDPSVMTWREAREMEKLILGTSSGKPQK